MKLILVINRIGYILIVVHISLFERLPFFIEGMLTRPEIDDLLHDARMDSIHGRVKESLLKYPILLIMINRYMRAMNEIEFNKEACGEEEKEEWDKIQKNAIEEYNAVRDTAKDIKLYTDQLHNNQSWFHHTVSSIGMFYLLVQLLGGVVNSILQNPVVSSIGTVEE